MTHGTAWQDPETELGLASGRQPDGTYSHVWFGKPVSIDEITFDKDVYLLTCKKAKQLASGQPPPEPTPAEPSPPEPEPEPKPGSGKKPAKKTVRISGAIPSEVWNRMSRTVIAKLRNAGDVRVKVELEVDVYRFLSCLLSKLRRPLTVVLDRLSAHRGAARRLKARFGDRIEFEWLPAYAPELNPVEHVWGHTKYGDLANYVPEDIDALRSELTASLERKRGDGDLLRSFFKQAGLEL